MKLQLFISLIVILNGCTAQKEIAVPGSDSIRYTKINLNDIEMRLTQLNGNYVEAEGIFVSGYEEFSLHMIGPKDTRYVWLEISEALNNRRLDFKSMTNRKVVIRGRLNSLEHGHMGSYSCTIKDIYYWKTL